jgi:beta-lactamase superfamily II metal-dependent hydrolase
MRILTGLLVAMVLAAVPAAQTRAATSLDIYLVDVEGGNATLFVSPSGESLLIDAGLRQIDNLIITHYHGDHFGGVAEVAARLPIRNYIDHGANVQPTDATNAFLQKVYPELYAKARHTVVKPGDRIPVAGLDVRVVAAAGQVIQTPMPGAGAKNPYCADYKPQDPDPTENAQSVGSYITFGRFRVVHLGDLTWNKEFALMCPNNRLGQADLFIVSHHGQPISNGPVLVHAIAPRVALLNNGTRKGGQPDAMKVLFSSPGLEDLWQIHFSQLSGQEYTVPGVFIANGIDEPQAAMPIAAIAPPAPGPGAPPPPAHNGPAFWIKVSAQQDGTFTVTNARNGFTKTYAALATARR